jgi:CheY-specific phosphatase CheX
MTSAEPAELEPEQEAILRRVVTESCVEMFTSAGFVVRLLEVARSVPGGRDDIAGFIGFGGEVRGSLMLAATTQFFNSTAPAPDPSGRLSESDLFDWTGEMANQLLGRIKRRFCGLGRDFHASTPTAIGGRQLGRRFPHRAGVIDLVIGVGGDVLSICFEITPPIDGKIFPPSATPLAVSSEGDLHLF